MIWHRVWFRLSLILLGVFLIVMSTPWIGVWLWLTIDSALWQQSGGLGAFLLAATKFEYMLPLVPAALQIFVGLGLIAFSDRLARKVVPLHLTACPHCGYELDESGDGLCSECGCEIPAAWRRRPTGGTEAATADQSPPQ